MQYSVEPWKAGRRWIVVAPDGANWRETSDEAEAREAVRPGDKLYRQFIRTETEYREIML